MPTSNARIGYVNLLEYGTVVASSENPEFPVENCYDWNTGDWFKPAASGTITIDLTLPGPMTADYFAYYGQNLYQFSGTNTIRLQYWNSGSGTYIDAFAAIHPDDNSPQFKSFNSRTTDKWRVVIVATDVFALNAISFGPQLALEYGMYLDWTPPILARDTKLITSRADGGAFLGRSVISTGISTDIILQGASDSWMRTNWVDFVEAAEKRAFFFVPDITNHSSEAVYCWVEETIPKPKHTNYGYMGATIPIKGLVE